MSNHMLIKEWDEITYINSLDQQSDRWSLEMEKYFHPIFIMEVITYPFCD